MTEPLSPQTLVYGFTIASDARISPDGSQVVYTLSKAAAENKKASSQLWICDRDGANKRQLTFEGQRNGGAAWSPDGRSVAFVSDREPKSGIYVLSLDGGDARELTRHQQGISSLAWSPDGSRIAYITDFDPDNPDEEERNPDAAPKVRVTSRLDYKLDGLGYRGEVRKQLFVVDVESGQRRRLTGEPNDFQLPVWSPDGKTIAAAVTSGGFLGTQLALVDAESGEIKRVGAERGSLHQKSWSPDGKRIAIAKAEQPAHQAEIFVYDVAAEDLRHVVGGFDWNPAGGGYVSATEPQWLDDQTVLMLGIQAGGGSVFRVDLESGGIERIYRSEARAVDLHFDAEGRYAVQPVNGLERRGEIEVIDLREGSGTLITSYSDEVLETAPPASWERFEIERGGMTIESWLLKPPNFDETKRYPVVLDIHGGPHNYYGYDFNDQHQVLASDGFLVVYSNPRGSMSYGQDFISAVVEDWGGEDYLDLLAVVDKVLEHPYADAERVGIRGYSYGGYMTAWMIGQTDRFKAAVCGAPCFDLESFYGTSDVGARMGDVEFGGPAHENPEWYEQHSPSFYAHRATTPTLIIHGEADDRCPIGQGEQMFVALKTAGCEVEFARYPGGAHGFVMAGNPEHREDVLERTLRWFKDHLGEPE